MGRLDGKVCIVTGASAVIAAMKCARAMQWISNGSACFIGEEEFDCQF